MGIKLKINRSEVGYQIKSDQFFITLLCT